MIRLCKIPSPVRWLTSSFAQRKRSYKVSYCDVPPSHSSPLPIMLSYRVFSSSRSATQVMDASSLFLGPPTIVTRSGRQKALVCFLLTAESSRSATAKCGAQTLTHADETVHCSSGSSIRIPNLADSRSSFRLCLRFSDVFDTCTPASAFISSRSLDNSLPSNSAIIPIV